MGAHTGYLLQVFRNNVRQATAAAGSFRPRRLRRSPGGAGVCRAYFVPHTALEPATFVRCVGNARDHLEGVSP